MYIPPSGKIRRYVALSTSSISPSHQCGTAFPSTVNTRTTWSGQRPRFSAANTPSGIPNSPSRNAPSESWKLAGIRSRILSSTGRRSMNE